MKYYFEIAMWLLWKLSNENTMLSKWLSYVAAWIYICILLFMKSGVMNQRISFELVTYGINFSIKTFVFGII